MGVARYRIEIRGGLLCPILDRSGIWVQAQSLEFEQRQANAALARREEQLLEMAVMGDNAACNLMAAIRLLSGEVEYGETMVFCKNLREKARSIIAELEGE